jgi:hypothetical protein
MPYFFWVGRSSTEGLNSEICLARKALYHFSHISVHSAMILLRSWDHSHGSTMPNLHVRLTFFKFRLAFSDSREFKIVFFYKNNYSEQSGKLQEACK